MHSEEKRIIDYQSISWKRWVVGSEGIGDTFIINDIQQEVNITHTVDIECSFIPELQKLIILQQYHLI